MKFKFYCRVNEDNNVINFLETQKIKYEAGPIPKRIYFTIYSDTEGIEDFLRYIQVLPESLISKSSVFSNEEMEDANWYSFNVTRMGIDTKNEDYTYEAKCQYVTQYKNVEIKKCYHLDQINSFVSSKTPKWKNGYNFCSVETGNTTKIFCSDYAKERIIENGITGVSFMPVLKGYLKTQTPGVSQLIFNNKLPLEAYTLIGDYEECVCPLCGRINYIFKEPNCDNIRLNKDLLPKGVDAFGSEIIIGYGHGQELIVISKKFYNLITKELKEKSKHFIFEPVG